MNDEYTNKRREEIKKLSKEKELSEIKVVDFDDVNFVNLSDKDIEEIETKRAEREEDKETKENNETEESDGREYDRDEEHEEKEGSSVSESAELDHAAEEVYLGLRLNVAKAMLNDLKQSRHTLLLGGHGMGKSKLAQVLVDMHQGLFDDEKWVYCFFCNPASQVLKFALYEVADDEAEYKEYKKNSACVLDLAFKLLEVLEKKDLRIVIVLDEIHTITGTSAAVYNILMQKSKRIAFLAIGNPQYIGNRLKKPECKRFFWEFKRRELLPLDSEDTAKLTNKLFNHYKIAASPRNKLEFRKIVNQSKGNPLTIKRTVSQVAKKENPEIIYHGAVRDEPINLFPLIMLGVFVIFGLRYLYRGVGNYQAANLVSFLGLIMMFVMRYFLMRRRKY